jgi:putative flippase GtrA
MTWRSQFLRFGLVGGVVIGIDSLTFILATHFGMALEIANLFARGIGSVAAFFLHRRVSFANQQVDAKWSLAKQMVGYFLLWALNYLVSTAVLWHVAENYARHILLVCKPAIEIILALSNFLWFKFYLFARRR